MQVVSLASSASPNCLHVHVSMCSFAMPCGFGMYSVPFASFSVTSDRLQTHIDGHRGRVKVEVVMPLALAAHSLV